LRQHKIRHLPIVRGARLVGILTDRDLKRVSPSPATSLSVYEVNYLLDKLDDDPEETVKAIEKAGYPVLSAAV
jgi:CBS domain-containing protein